MVDNPSTAVTSAPARRLTISELSMKAEGSVAVVFLDDLFVYFHNCKFSKQ